MGETIFCWEGRLQQSQLRFEIKSIKILFSNEELTSLKKIRDIMDRFFLLIWILHLWFFLHFNGDNKNAQLIAVLRIWIRTDPFHFGGSGSANHKTFCLRIFLPDPDQNETDPQHWFIVLCF